MCKPLVPRRCSPRRLNKPRKRAGRRQNGAQIYLLLYLDCYVESSCSSDLPCRFKLRIRPKHSNSAEDATIDKIPPLPFDLNPVDIASDFFKYLFDCTRDYIKESHANGEDLWRSIENDIDFVISHPNGWGGYQQSQLREAVQKAKLTVDGQAPKVSFITEGEASLHFALRNGLPAAVMEVSLWSMSTRRLGIHILQRNRRGMG